MVQAAVVALLELDVGSVRAHKPRVATVVDGPVGPEAVAQVADHVVAVTQETHVEVAMLDRVLVDEDLRHLRRHLVHDIGHGRHLERGADADDQVAVLEVARDVVVEHTREGLAEERDVRLHHAVALLHHGLVVAQEAGALLQAARAVRDLAVAHDRVERLALDTVATGDAGGEGKGAVALDHLVRRDAGVGLQVVDILCVVAQELALVLEQADEHVERRVHVVGRQDHVGDQVEDARVGAEDVQVEHLLRVGEAQVGEARVETLGRPEVRDPEAGGDAGARDDQDLVGGLELREHVVHGVEVVEPRPQLLDALHRQVQELDELEQVLARGHRRDVARHKAQLDNEVDDVLAGRGGREKPLEERHHAAGLEELARGGDGLLHGVVRLVRRREFVQIRRGHARQRGFGRASVGRARQGRPLRVRVARARVARARARLAVGRFCFGVGFGVRVVHERLGERGHGRGGRLRPLGHMLGVGARLGVEKHHLDVTGHGGGRGWVVMLEQRDVRSCVPPAARRCEVDVGQGLVWRRGPVRVSYARPDTRSWNRGASTVGLCRHVRVGRPWA